MDDLSHPLPLPKRRLRTWLRLLRLTRTVEAGLREHLRLEHDTTLPRFDVMAALYRRRDPITMSELSRQLLVSNGNATAVVDRLEKDGLARRSQAAFDRRTVHVVLTPEGVAAFAAMAASHEAVLDGLLSHLTHADMDALRDILRRALPDPEEKT